MLSGGVRCFIQGKVGDGFGGFLGFTLSWTASYQCCYTCNGIVNVIDVMYNKRGVVLSIAIAYMAPFQQQDKNVQPYGSITALVRFHQTSSILRQTFLRSRHQDIKGLSDILLLCLWVGADDTDCVYTLYNPACQEDLPARVDELINFLREFVGCGQLRARCIWHYILPHKAFIDTGIRSTAAAPIDKRFFRLGYNGQHR